MFSICRDSLLSSFKSRALTDERRWAFLGPRKSASYLPVELVSLLLNNIEAVLLIFDTCWAVLMNTIPSFVRSYWAESRSLLVITPYRFSELNIVELNILLSAIKIPSSIDLR